MVVVLMGCGCTGKTTAAETLRNRYGLAVSEGKDYLRLARNEADAWKAFAERLKAAEPPPLGPESIVYVVAEPDMMPKLSGIRAARILFTADGALVLERFRSRLAGNPPPQLAQMLERKAQAWRNAPCDLAVDTTNLTPDGVVSRILDFLGQEENT